MTHTADILYSMYLVLMISTEFEKRHFIITYIAPVDPL